MEKGEKNEKKSVITRTVSVVSQYDTTVLCGRCGVVQPPPSPSSTPAMEGYSPQEDKLEYYSATQIHCAGQGSSTDWPKWLKTRTGQLKKNPTHPMHESMLLVSS